MSVLEMEATESPKMWFDHNPWGGRLAFMALGAAASLFIRAGIVNYEHEKEVRQTTAAQVHAADTHTLNRVLATIPKGTPSKSETVSTEPANCIPHPDPQPSP